MAHIISHMPEKMAPKNWRKTSSLNFRHSIINEDIILIFHDGALIRLKVCKAIVIGDVAVGKTCLINR